MSLFQVGKPKSAAKIMMPAGEMLENEVLRTLTHMAEMAGATLGPGGKQVLIERPEIGHKPIITKDGVTVIKNLGYESATQQLILEAARDAAIRTASEAGDGTTTATILSSAIAQYTAAIVRKNARVSPQKIVREMQALFPLLAKKIESYKINVDGANYSDVLLKVATLSANGDLELARAILECADLVGDEGNLTIIEAHGPSRYEIERLNGYTIEKGFEESCRNFANGFINDKSGSGVYLENPIFLLFDGVINDMTQVFEAMSKLGQHMKASGRHDKGVVLVAHGFSDSFLGDLHVNWNHPNSLIQIYPVLTPERAIQNYRTEILYDLQAYTGSIVYNPIDCPINDLDPETICKTARVRKMESGRFKTTIIVDEDIDSIQIRVDELKSQKESPESDYELNELNVRIGKLTSGIARLNIYGLSAGETREKRDRADDSWMAIRGAQKHGALPGGGYVLVRLAADLQVLAQPMADSPKKYAINALGESLLEPVKVLYYNYGYSKADINQQLYEILNNDAQTFDISGQEWVDRHAILDSVPAVLEAIRNSISIASLLGTIGGIVAFRRDGDSDRSEEQFVRNFEAAVGERGSVSGAS